MRLSYGLRLRFSAVSIALSLLVPIGSARAFDLPKLLDKPLKLDLTETSVVAQRFDARDKLQPKDHGWGQWQNKLNAALVWDKLTLGARFDSNVYWLRPVDRERCATCTFKPDQEESLLKEGAGRFQNNFYPAKIYATYKTRNFDITLGDAYAQFGRGLTLSLRKVDELGIDTTVRGIKAGFLLGPVAGQVLLGLGNPTRVDEASGAALFPTRALPEDRTGSYPLFGADRIFGAQLTAGRGLPVVLSTHVVRISRCAPYRYDAEGRIETGAFATPFGDCDAEPQAVWLEGLSRSNPLRQASRVDMLGQVIEIPDLWGHGSLYLEAAVQRRPDELDRAATREGNAFYGTLLTNFGKLTNTLEFKSYRNFRPTPASVDTGRAGQFSNVQYTNVPTTEILIQDSMFGNFNECVTGGKLRSDYRLQSALLVYGTAGYYHTRSEHPGASGCDRTGTDLSDDPELGNNYVTDVLSGIEWRFDKDRSQVLASVGARNDVSRSGAMYYRERSLNYSVSIFLGGPFSFELSGRHRTRKQEQENLNDVTGQVGTWWQGFHNTAFKIAPKWVIAQGVEYLTLAGFPTVYVNGSLLYRFTSESNIKLLIGQQQGGLRCISGVCRIFPAFEGVRAELTIRL
jgi:Family of unknown function (DUF6029)